MSARHFILIARGPQVHLVSTMLVPGFAKKEVFFWFRNWYITIVHLWWGQLSMDFSAGSVFYFRFGFSQLDCCKQLVAPCKVVRVCRWEIVGSWLLMVIPVTPSLATTMNIEQRPDIDLQITLLCLLYLSVNKWKSKCKHVELGFQLAIDFRFPPTVLGYDELSRKQTNVETLL